MQDDDSIYREASNSMSVQYVLITYLFHALSQIRKASLKSTQNRLWLNDFMILLLWLNRVKQIMVWH